MRRVTPVILLAMMLLLQGGCAKRYRMKPEYGERARKLIGPVSGQAGALDVLWESSFNSKPSGPLSVHGGALAVPSAKRRIEFFDLTTGERLGRIKTGTVVNTGLLYFDTLAVFGTEMPRSRVVCWNLVHRREVWRVPTEGVEGIIATDSARILVAERKGRVSLYDVKTGEPVWSLDVEGSISSPPYLFKRLALIGCDDGRIVAIDPASGTISWESPDLGASVVAFGERWFISPIAITSDGAVHSIRPDDGRVGHTEHLSRDRLTSPVIDAWDVICLASSLGEIIAIEWKYFHEMWRYDTDQAIRAAPVIQHSGVGSDANAVIAATLRGEVISLNVSSGEVIDQRDLGSAIVYPPVFFGGRIYVATADGDVVCLGGN